MTETCWQLHRKTAQQIWQAGVWAVDSCLLVKNSIEVTGNDLVICGTRYPLSQSGKIVVVGAGKAGAGMAAGIEAALPAHLLNRLTGWVNVPADCVKPLKKIQLHPARPAGINEPTEQGIIGTGKILELVANMNPDDLCIVLLSGGGSALLPCPAGEITLQEKLDLTRDLARAGATIEELNTVRRSVSKVKAGGLAKACSARHLVSLIISDVINDPLEMIASGPTIISPADPQKSLQITEKYIPGRIPETVLTHLENTSSTLVDTKNEKPVSEVNNIIIGSNEIAVAAACSQAKQLGYEVHNMGSANTGTARELGVRLVRKADEIRQKIGSANCPVCIICGGETTVPMDPRKQPGKGGRNQELVLAALIELSNLQHSGKELTILSGGTDGEDGPTDAAGAFADAETITRAARLNLDPTVFLEQHNSYPFFEACNSLLITGPTDTNVMDLSVLLINPDAAGVL